MNEFIYMLIWGVVDTLDHDEGDSQTCQVDSLLMSNSQRKSVLRTIFP